MSMGSENKGVRINADGLSSRDAITKLKLTIEKEIEKYVEPNNSSYFSLWFKDALHYKNYHSIFPLTSATILACEVVLLLLYQIYADQNFRTKLASVETLFLLISFFVNICLVSWDSKLRHSEMASKIKSTLKILEEIDDFYLERDQHYNLHRPQSPCISVQWTYRDGLLINLPSALLVEGDVILMRPGHAAPGYCMSLNKSVGSQEILKMGQVFVPIDKESTLNFNSPRLRNPARSTKFVLLETPISNQISCALQNSLKRPISLFMKEYYAIVFDYLERIVFPAILIVILTVGSIHAVYFETSTYEWSEYLLLRPVLATLPLLPLALPSCWILFNAYGNAYLLAIINSKQCLKSFDPFDEIEELPPSSIEKYVKWRDLRYYFCALLLGKKDFLWRSANLLQVLGSITALCCVDKKGILSWPNPTAEKVFILKSPKSKSNSENSAQTCDDREDSSHEMMDEEPPDNNTESKKVPKIQKKLDVKDHIFHPGSQVEVLDLTHNLHSPFGIQFDDPNWKLFIGNLKPLGLGILLNTCNPKAQEHYTKFSDHVACESVFNESAVPVVNKRCLCELAKQIGFTNSVVDFYDLEEQLGIFRHVLPEVVQKGKLAKSLNFSRLKMPFPNMFSAVVKDLHRGSSQLFSQGTADLLLDACNEYWDGNDIHILTDSDRKRILDFYHRSSLTAHCMGYAYSPLNQTASNILADAYIELPAEGYHLFSSLETSNYSPRSWDPPCIEGMLCPPSMNRHLSSDSLIVSEKESEKPKEGAEGCLRKLKSEIFIGMVTMQYQACPDFVQLIEQLDKACIRFVHFSKENELRSRVFSEKMGLESGWNCHISLLSEDSNSKKDSGDDTPLKFPQYSFLRNKEDISLGKKKTDNFQHHSSAPNLANVEPSNLKLEGNGCHSKNGSFASVGNMMSCKSPKESDALFEDEPKEYISGKSVTSLQDIFITDGSNVSHSPSHVTESTEQSAPVTFDMSNRAKLPKGTENIRPHIENVDNVPLQVSLFTDCTAEATREMICIMQEYGEVVCCVGSASNTENMSIFLQADASIAIEPLLPQLCIQQSMYEENSGQKQLDGLSCVLNSLPCSIFFHREDPVSLYHLIMEARHLMCTARKSMEFLVCCCLSVVVVQVLSVLFFLPLVLPLSHVLWLVCLEAPLLACALLSSPTDPQVMTMATGKNLKVANRQAMFFFIAYYCAKFGPSVLMCVFCFACIMSSACERYLNSDSHVCWISLDLSKTEKQYTSDAWIAALTVGQNVVSFFLALYFVIISMSFVHRSHLLWKSSPFSNKYWLLAAVAVLCLHLMFNVVDISLHINKEFKATEILQHIPYYVWLVCSLWPFIMIPLNELVKRHEIKVNVRQQKRARLEFCTKLGMNSPF